MLEESDFDYESHENNWFMEIEQKYWEIKQHAWAIRHNSLGFLLKNQDTLSKPVPTFYKNCFTYKVMSMVTRGVVYAEAIRVSLNAIFLSLLLCVLRNNGEIYC
jgi:hypothetical protein